MFIKRTCAIQRMTPKCKHAAVFLHIHMHAVLEAAPDAADDGAELAVLHRPPRRRLVEVGDKDLIELVVGEELALVHAVAVHGAVSAVARQVRHPAAHQVQHRLALGDALPACMRATACHHGGHAGGH